MAHPRSAPGGPPTQAPRRPLVRVLPVLLCVLVGGCAMPEPWVKPYERERLADPIMQFSRSPLAEKHREHVHLVREAARGATGVQGGGCGCN